MPNSDRDPVAWQKGIVFVKEVYAASACFPREEMHGRIINGLIASLQS